MVAAPSRHNTTARARTIGCIPTRATSNQAQKDSSEENMPAGDAKPNSPFTASHAPMGASARSDKERLAAYQLALHRTKPKKIQVKRTCLRATQSQILLSLPATHRWVPAPGPGREKGACNPRTVWCAN